MEWRPGIGQNGFMNIYGKDRTCCIDNVGGQIKLMFIRLMSVDWSI